MKGKNKKDSSACIEEEIIQVSSDDDADAIILKDGEWMDDVLTEPDGTKWAVIHREAKANS